MGNVMPITREVPVPRDNFSLNKGAEALAFYDGLDFDKIPDRDDYRRKALAVLQAVHGPCGIRNNATGNTCLWDDASCGCNNDE